MAFGRKPAPAQAPLLGQDDAVADAAQQIARCHGLERRLRLVSETQLDRQETAETLESRVYYTLRVGSFARERDAKRLVARLQKFGARIVERGGAHQVLVGVARGMPAAKLLKADFQSNSKLSAVIVRL